MSSPAEVPAPAAPSARRDLLLLLLFWAVVYFVPLGLRPLSNPDEGRYVEIGREMAATGDFVSPRLNGILYFEKPPLFYWLEAGAVAAGGMNLWALRFWPAVLALLGALAVYGTGRALWGRDAGWWSALALLTSLLYFGLSQIIILDMAVSVFITGALCAFILAVRAPPGPDRFRFCCALYVCMTLALLAKGLIGVLIPCAIAFLWLLLLNRWRELRHAYLSVGIFILLALGLPWHVAATFANPPPDGWDLKHFFTSDWTNQGFLWYYFWHEHVLRYMDPGTSNRVQPAWFFFAILPAGFLPWVVFLPQAVLAACKGGWARLKAEPEILALFLWVLFPLLFFSASSSKLIPYILPSVPPLALLTGRYLALALNNRGGAPLLWPLRALQVLGLALGVGMLLAPHLNIKGLPPAITGVLQWVGALFLLGTIFVSVLLRPRAPQVRQGLLGVTAIVAVFLFHANMIAGPVIDARRPSTQRAAEWLRPQLQPGDRVFVLWDYGPYQDFAPWLGRTIGIGGHMPDEQEFGAMLEPWKFTDRYPGLLEYLMQRQSIAQDKPDPTIELSRAFAAELGRPPRMFVLVPAKKFPEFKSRFPGAPANEWWNDGQFVVFSNQPKPATPAP